MIDAGVVTIGAITFCVFFTIFDMTSEQMYYQKRIARDFAECNQLRDKLEETTDVNAKEAVKIELNQVVQSLQVAIEQCAVACGLDFTLQCIMGCKTRIVVGNECKNEVILVEE